MKHAQNRGMTFKIVILWLAILLVGSFWLTAMGGSDQMSLAVLPGVPREGEPVVATFQLNNPSSAAIETEYQFYANGELMKEGTTTLSPTSSKVYQYAYSNPLLLGEQVNFVLKVSSPQGSHQEIVSLPSYPPQIWSSFVSFASFSTSMMSFMSSVTYYQSTFGSQPDFNVGLLYIIILIGLLIFLELTQPLLQGKATAVLGRLRLEYSTVTWILFIIFIGIVYTKIVMVLTTIW